MFYNKRFNEIEKRIEFLSKGIHQLECPHDNQFVSFKKTIDIWNTLSPFFGKYCNACLKTLKIYSTEVEYLQEKQEFMTTLIKENEERIKKLKENEERITNFTRSIRTKGVDND